MCSWIMYRVLSFASVHDLMLVVDHWQGSDDQFAVLILDKSVAE